MFHILNSSLTETIPIMARESTQQVNYSAALILLGVRYILHILPILVHINGTCTGICCSE